MHKIWAVIRREFVERVRTKVFIIATVLGPVFFAIMVIVPGYLMTRSAGTKSVAVIDATTTGFGSKVTRALEQARIGGGPAAPVRYNLVRIPAAGREIAVRDSLVRLTGLSRRVEGGGFTGLLLVNDSAVSSGKHHYLGNNVGSIQDMELMEQLIRPVVITERLGKMWVDPAE